MQYKMNSTLVNSIFNWHQFKTTWRRNYSAIKLL